MTKIGIENFDPSDTHSINISVYKPDGILSFWNWFTKRNKNDGQRKNIKFKINKEDLEKMKLSGFDFQKLQNLDLNNKNQSTRQCNVFAIPKTDLDPFLLKSLHPTLNTKTYVKRLISKSTISIKSKESSANLKYIRTVRSQKSVVNSVQSSKPSFKVSMRSNTNVHFQTNQQPRNVFLKSVPTTVLKSNTRKMLIVGKVKSPKGNRTARTNGLETNSQHAKENVIPMLLTRMKSMEEHLSDIENTTKKINEAVSQRNVVTKVNSRNDLSGTERNRQKAIKCVASHKIYSKNIHAPRKHKKNRPKKLKNKSKTNLTLREGPAKLGTPNKGFAFNYFSDSSNDFRKTNDLGQGDVNHNKPGLFFNQHSFTLPNNLTKLEFSHENASSVGCDFIMSVVKALTETKGSTNLKQVDSSNAQDNTQYPNVGAKLGVINLDKSNFMSKSTFDWKHNSVNTCSEPHITSETGKSNQESIKVKKNVSVTFGKQDLSHVPCERNEILNQILIPNLQKQVVLELLRNNTNPLARQDELKTIGDTQTRHTEKHFETIDCPNPDLEVIEYKCRDEKININVDGCVQYAEIGLQKTASTQPCLSKQKSAHSTKCPKSCKETDEQEKFQSVENNNIFHGVITATEAKECPQSGVLSCTQKRPHNLQSCEAKGAEIIVDRRALCSVSIEPNAVLSKSLEKQLKRTTISSSNAEKEPKVSITILVQDSMKDKVEMKSNILNNLAASKCEHVDQLLKETYSPPLSNFGPRGDNLSEALSNVSKTGSLCSLENFSSVSCSGNETKANELVPKTTIEQSIQTRTKKNFYVEVKDERRNNPAEDGLRLGSPGSYLNYEKRKVLEEKVLGFKQNKSLTQSVYGKEPLSPTRSDSNISNGLSSYDHLIETSIIHQETSYSKTKFNISKENKYNPRRSQRPLESCRKCLLSDESLRTENNFDISTKYMSQQCVMYCRNDNMTNFKRPKYPLLQENPLENTEFEYRKQPFLLVHTPSNSRDKLEDCTNMKSTKARQMVLNLQEDPILEVSEDESAVENISLSDHKMVEKNIHVTKSSLKVCKINLEHSFDKDANRGSNQALLDYIGRPTRKDQTVQNGSSQTQNESSVVSKASIQYHNTSMGTYVLDSESKSVAHLITNEPRTEQTNFTSQVSQTELSSTLVQTDWSLVGITVDHLNSSSNKSEACKKRTIASQTDVKMDQIALMNKDLEEMHTCCKMHMKNCQFSELVACNVTVSQATNLQESAKNLLGNRQVFLGNDIKEGEVADTLGPVIKEKDLNILAYSNSNTLPINVDDMEGNLLDQLHTPTLSSSNIKSSCNRNLTSKSSLFCENQTEEILKTVKEDLLHRCTIPCFPTLSDDTMKSDLSESSCKMTSRSQTVPQVHAINRGICSYYSQSDETHASNQVSLIEESRPSTSDTANSAFCRVIGGIDVDDKEFSQDENYPQSLTSLGTLEAGKDETTDEVNVSLDCPLALEVISKEETKLEHESEKVSAKVQGRKISFKNHSPGKTRKGEYYENEKCPDYLINYLSINRCNDEKNGNSVFSLT